MKRKDVSVDGSESNPVVLVGSDTKELLPLISGYGDRVKQVHFFGELEGAFVLREHFKGTVKVFAGAREGIIRNSVALKEGRFFICPEFPVEKREDISFITSMGIAVDLLYRVEGMAVEVIREILRYYLYHPSLVIPVEPFHSILMAKVRDRKINLWGLYFMFPELEFRVVGEGRPGSDFYCALMEWKGSDFRKEGGVNGLKAYFELIPREYPGCMGCDQFYFCFSWGKYKRDRCELWKGILDQLQINAREIRNVIKKDNHPSE